MRGLICGLALLLWPALSPAGEIPCTPVEAGTIQLDGLLGDWKGVEGVGVDDESSILKGRDEWSGPADLSFDVYCNTSNEGLYLAISVKDEYFIRTKGAGAGDDHLGVQFGARTLVIHPGNLRDVGPKVVWRGGKAKGVKMAEAMQKGGYSVELFLPWKLVPGYRPGIASLPGTVWVSDSDSRAKGKPQTLMATAPSPKSGAFTFAQAKVDLQSLLRDKGYSARDVRTKINADVVGDRRVEQVLLVGRSLAIVGEGLPGDGRYFYLDLPVKSGKDVYWLKVMDLNGDGKGELVTRYAERAGNGRRELLAVFHFNESDQFVRWFAHEIFKGQGSRTLINRFAFKPWKGGKGKKRAHGIDIIIDKPAATGFSADSYQEVPSPDCFSILLPWGEDRKRQFRFEGDQFEQL